MEDFPQCFCNYNAVCGVLTVPSAVSAQQAAKLWQYVRMKDREPVIGQYKMVEI